METVTPSVPALLQLTDTCYWILDFSGGSVVKDLPANARDWVSMPGYGRCPEKEMVAHSSILPWKIPWIGNLVAYSPWDHKRVRNNLVTKHQ